MTDSQFPLTQRDAKARWITVLSWAAILGGVVVTAWIAICVGPTCFWHGAHDRNTVFFTGLIALAFGILCVFCGRYVRNAKMAAKERLRQLEQRRRASGPTSQSDLEQDEEIRAARNRVQTLDHIGELIVAMLVVILCCLLLVFLFTAFPNIFDVPSFDRARVEWFLMVGWGVAIVGAIWAVLAKLKADMAFEQAQIAAQRSEAAYYAVTTKSLSFHELTVGGRLREHISKGKDELILLLGSPFVGYFGEGRLSDSTAKNIGRAAKYIGAAEQIAFAIQAQFAVAEKARVVFFNWDLCAELADKTNVDRMALRGLYDGFSTALRPQSNSSGEGLPAKFAVSYKMLGIASPVGPLPEKEDKLKETNTALFDPGIRIAISKDDDYRHAYVWFVEGFVDQEPSNFSSVAFETKDPTLIRLLESLVEEYAKKLAAMLGGSGNSGAQSALPSGAVADIREAAGSEAQSSAEG